jgi:hypothetical protein
VISPRDEIWIDMMQFDVRAADRLWEGTAPAQGAPGWYDDVSGLIETASGPAEPHELVDEPIVVEDMHRTALGRRPRHCRHRRTVGRVIAMKAAFATTAGVFGVAAAAAATTGIVATVASVVVPVIEEHVLSAQDDPDVIAPVALPPSPGRSQDPSLDYQLLTEAAAQPAGPTPAVTTPPSEPAVEAVDAARPPEPALVEPVAADPAPPPDPAGVTPEPPPATEPAPPADPAPVAPPPVEPPPGDASPPGDAPPDKVVPPRDTAASPDANHRGSGSGRTHKGGRKAAHHDAPDKASVKSAEHPRPAHSRPD